MWSPKKRIALPSSLVGILLLSGCTSTGPGLVEREARCTKWQDVGPPAKSYRVRVKDKNCQSALPETADGNISA